VVREGVTVVALYCVPAAPMFMYVKKVDKAVSLGKNLNEYVSNKEKRLTF